MTDSWTDSIAKAHMTHRAEKVSTIMSTNYRLLFLLINVRNGKIKKFMKTIKNENEPPLITACYSAKCGLVDNNARKMATVRNSIAP